MADDADRADDRIQRMIDEGMARARASSARSLRPIVKVIEGTNKQVGVCHNCEDEIMVGRLFCSKECSDDHEAQREARKRNGN